MGYQTTHHFQRGHFRGHSSLFIVSLEYSLGKCKQDTFHYTPYHSLFIVHFRYVRLDPPTKTNEVSIQRNGQKQAKLTYSKCVWVKFHTSMTCGLFDIAGHDSGTQNWF